MSMVINHNLNAMDAHRNLVFNNKQEGKWAEKLSSGYRINRAADDAAGLSISEKMRAQISSLTQANRNSQDGVSLVQTADGAMNEVSDMLVRMKELATQANNGTYNASDRAAMNNEFTALESGIDSIAKNTTFNGINLLNTSSSAVNIQTGDTSTNKVTVSLVDITTSALSLSSVSIDTATNASTAMAKIDTAIGTVNKDRSQFGALQNRLEHVGNNLSTTTENLTAAESRIRDTDMASAMMKYSKFSILQQAATSMLAQANQQPQGVLQLLR